MGASGLLAWWRTFAKEWFISDVASPLLGRLVGGFGLVGLVGGLAGLVVGLVGLVGGLVGGLVALVVGLVGLFGGLVGLFGGLVGLVVGFGFASGQIDQGSVLLRPDEGSEFFSILP